MIRVVYEESDIAEKNTNPVNIFSPMSLPVYCCSKHFFFVEVAHYTLYRCLKSAEKYLIMKDSMKNVKYVSQMGGVICNFG